MDVLFANRPISFSALKDFSILDQPTRHHLKDVYSCLAASMISSALGASVNLFMQGGLFWGLASIGLLYALSFNLLDGKNQTNRLGCLMGYAFFAGLALGPLMNFIIHVVDSSTIVIAFFVMVLVFGCFAACALWAEERIHLYIGGTLGSCLSVLLILPLVNLFFETRIIIQFQLYCGVLLFCGFVIYGTQLIVYKCCCDKDKDYIWHSVELFLDLVVLFVYIYHQIIIILIQIKESKKEDSKKEDSKNDSKKGENTSNEKVTDHMEDPNSSEVMTFNSGSGRLEVVRRSVARQNRDTDRFVVEDMNKEGSGGFFTLEAAKLFFGTYL